MKELFALAVLCGLTVVYVVSARRRVEPANDFHEQVWREYRRRHQRRQLIAGERKWN